MATRTLINRKTRKEFKTADAEEILKRYPRAFILKPLTELDKEVLEKEKAIKESMDLLSEGGHKPGNLEKALGTKKRAELDELAKIKGIDPVQFRTKADLISAIINPVKPENHK